MAAPGLVEEVERTGPGARPKANFLIALVGTHFDMTLGLNYKRAKLNWKQRDEQWVGVRVVRFWKRHSPECANVNRHGEDRFCAAGEQRP